MGRVYEALKRATESGTKKRADDSAERNGQRAAGGAANGGAGQQEHPWDRSPLFAVPRTASTISASTAHTETFTGSALPGELASRAAGATLDAAGSTPAVECVSLDISPTRVE